MQYPQRNLAFFLAFALLTLSSWAQAPDDYEPLRPQMAQRLQLPQSYRELALRLVKLQPGLQDAIAKDNPDKGDRTLRTWVLQSLHRTPEGGQFLRQGLEKESSQELRSWIVDALGGLSELSAADEEALRRRATIDPSPAVSLKALAVIEGYRRTELLQLLDKRNDLAQIAGDKAALAQLELRRDQLRFGNITLPRFAYRPPPVFAAASSGAAVRVLAFGDFGTGGEAQRGAAAAMRDYHKTAPFTLGITLGDNFYSTGLNDPLSERWRTEWEDLYGPLGIKFYPTFGNHDYKDADSPAAELAYSRLSDTWVFPAPFYSFTAGAAQFFALDTERLLTEQLEWLDAQLANSPARWKIVYSHHQIYSATRGEGERLVQRLLPILKKHQVDVYLCGHDHNLQELKAEEGLHFFVLGAGGAHLYEMKPNYPRSIFQSQEHGFGVLEIDPARLSVLLVGREGRPIHRRDIVKPTN